MLLICLCYLVSEQRAAAPSQRAIRRLQIRCCSALALLGERGHRVPVGEGYTSFVTASASRRASALLGLGAKRSLFRLMGKDTAYWYRRGRGVFVGEGRVSFRDVRLLVPRPPDDRRIAVRHHDESVMSKHRGARAGGLAGNAGASARTTFWNRKRNAAASPQRSVARSARSPSII